MFIKNIDYSKDPVQPFVERSQNLKSSRLDQQVEKTSSAFNKHAYSSELENRGAKKARKEPISLPKIDQEYLGDDENGQAIYKKTLKYNNICYTLTPIHTNLSEHLVWKAEADGKQYIIKTYHHLPGAVRQRDKILADKKGYEKITAFLQENKLPFFRLALAHIDPSVAGFLLTEYVEGDSNFSAEWSDNTSVTDLTPNAVQILTQVRQLMELMWQSKTDLGDCRADNFVWKEGQLVFIDYAFVDKTSLDDLSGHLNHYIASWAKGNQSVSEFLYTNLQDLKKLGWESFISQEEV